MAAEITDLEQMMNTLAEASTDPNSVSVGDFAKAVQSLQAELKMLEAEVGRLGATVGSAFDHDDAEGADEVVSDSAATPAEASAPATTD